MIFIAFESNEEKNLFDEIYKKYDDMFTKYALSLTKNKAEAEEVLQEAYYRIIKYFIHVERVDEELRVNFLMSIIKNVANDFFTKRNKEVGADYLEDISDTALQNTNIGLYDVESEYLRNIITELDKKYRDVITLRYTYGYTSAEIGKLLGISESNVNARLSRARSKIREKYERGD